MSPKKEYKNIIAVIRTIDAKTEEVKSVQTKNIDGVERREWLKEAISKAAMWAMFNGCYIEVINQEDDSE